MLMIVSSPPSTATSDPAAPVDVNANWPDVVRPGALTVSQLVGIATDRSTVGPVGSTMVTVPSPDEISEIVPPAPQAHFVVYVTSPVALIVSPKLPDPSARPPGCGAKSAGGTYGVGRVNTTVLSAPL